MPDQALPEWPLVIHSRESRGGKISLWKETIVIMEISQSTQGVSSIVSKHISGIDTASRRDPGFKAIQHGWQQQSGTKGSKDAKQLEDGFTVCCVPATHMVPAEHAVE